MKNTSPILIGCSGSSGSTLLASLLASHPDIFCGPELSFFSKHQMYSGFDRVKEMLPRWMQSGLQSFGPMKDSRFLSDSDQYSLSCSDILNCLPSATDLPSFCEKIFSRCLQATHKSVLIEKTPANCYCFRLFLETFPDGKVIHIVRDGRDVVASLTKRHYTPYLAAARWICDVSAGLSCSENPRCYELRYEDLVTRPEETLNGLCSFVGVSYSDQMLARNHPVNARWDKHTGWGSSPTQDPINNRSVGRYKQNLPKDILQYLYHLQIKKGTAARWGLARCDFFSLLRRFGYEDADPRSGLYQTRCFFRYCVEECRGIASAVKHRTPANRPVGYRWH
jgi:hypothetical protein